VTGEGQWADYATLDADEVAPVDPTVADPEAYLGVLGMPGRTAYFGLLEVGEPKPGDTVVVSGAAGAVGSVVGQIAKRNGCRVVGFAGSDEKTAWLTDDLGFDAAINYKTTDDYRAALDEAAPDGVDVYYDNVGGPITDAVFTQLNLDARVAVCGQIAHYNDEEVPTGPRKLLTDSGASAGAGTACRRLRDPVRRGERAARALGRERRASTSRDGRGGVGERPDAFLGLFSGDNIGKQVVRVSAADEE